MRAAVLRSGIAGPSIRKDYDGVPMLTTRQRAWLAEAVYRAYGAAHP